MKVYSLVYRSLKKLLPPKVSNRITNYYLSGIPVWIIEGQKMRITDSGILEVYLSGGWEPHVVKLFRNSIKEGMTVVDIGARRGNYSLIAASLVGPTGQVLAFEPVPEFAKEIRLNATLNGYSKSILVYQVACSNTPRGMVDLYLDDGLCGSFAVNSQRKKIKVLQNRLDRLVDIERIHVVKLDVEGAELRVLQGMGRYMEDDIQFFIEVHPCLMEEIGDSVRSLLQYLVDFGFTYQAISKDGNLTPMDETMFQHNFHILAEKAERI